LDPKSDRQGDAQSGYPADCQAPGEGEVIHFNTEKHEGDHDGEEHAGERQ
jgi:hypothetical protein